MTFEDPFFVVKEEVSKALSKTRSLYQRWIELQDKASSSNLHKDELEWTTTELRNSLRSIEWDLEDLEDTISIVEKNPTKIKIDSKELGARKTFIEQTRAEVKGMKDKMNFARGRDKDRIVRQPLLDTSPVRVASSHTSTKYSRLDNQLDSPNRQFLTGLGQQSSMLAAQDAQLDMIAESIGTLKTVSHHINTELDEQAVMLDDFGHELGVVESKLDTTLKKVSKVLHISNDRRQWMTILVLSGLLVIIIILFIVL
ncbi:unnamed protein product [Bemisia tabaci]|uniref:t-SNARE coiled-coil homology domain-containing protein n=1 Tax=Bemisia tabaci TaxID=7038 RepID=A0A9P0AC74_BEMTA|nr:PREDICTED: syntaxin-6 [Bemisia tabaci]CAH0391243.1 unnamed protein product [Bemisia tabaci]